MSAQTRGLGRGLGALIPPASPTLPQQLAEGGVAPAGVLSVAVTDIVPNPHQPRSPLSPASLEDLAASIREHGLIQPLIVTRARPTEPGRYQLIAGERRWRAARLAGLTEVPVVVKETTPQQSLELALVENIQRADLNPLEEAEAFQSLMADFGMSQQEIAGRVGKSRVAVANAVRLLRLPAQVKTLLAQEALSEGHARALLGLPDEATIVRVAGQVVARDLTVRQTEELVRRLLAAAEAAQMAAESPDRPSNAAEPARRDLGRGLRLNSGEARRPDAQAEGVAEAPDVLKIQRLEEAFRNALGTKVSLTLSRRGGRLVIFFYSEEELQALYERIVGPE